MSTSPGCSESIIILTTQRQRLRTFTQADAAWLLEALNEPSFIEQVGDRQIRSVDQALVYLDQHLHAHYQQHGYGMWLCERLLDQRPIGMCGLVRRETLDAPDIGYAYRPEFWGQGYAIEAARATAAAARSMTGSDRLLGITSSDNIASMKVLKQLGMQDAGSVSVTTENDSQLFEMDLL